MHILLNGTYAASNYRGWGRYSMELLAALATIDRENQYSVHYTVGTGHRERLEARLSVPNFQLRGFPDNGAPRSEIACGAFIEKHFPSVDVYHCLTEFPARLRNRNIVITIHELTRMSAPKNRTAEERRHFEDSIREALDLAKAVVVVSNNTRDELFQCFPGLSVPVRRIWNGVADVFSEKKGKVDEDVLGGLAETRFVLFVGAVDDPDKNFPFLIDGLLRVDPAVPLVVVTRDHDARSLIEKFAIPSSLAEHLCVFVEIPDLQLAALYRNCQLFVFPSYHEGFGLPLVEAIACGAPVLCSRSSSLVEIADGLCAMFETENLSDFVFQLQRCLYDYPRALLVPAAEHVRTTFRWEACAREHIAVYKSLGERSGP